MGACFAGNQWAWEVHRSQTLVRCAWGAKIRDGRAYRLVLHPGV